MNDVQSLAARLIQAHRQGQLLDVGPESGPHGVEAAYAVQAEVWRALSDMDRPSAWKAAAVGREIEPIAAPVFQAGLTESPAHFRRGLFVKPGIEAEIALRFGRDLPARAEPYGRDAVLDAIASAHVAIEVVDTRLADPEAAGPLWRLADGLLNGGLVLGATIPGWREIDFDALVVRILADETPIAETVGRPPLGDIFHCLPWWLVHIGGVRAGDIVTTGAWNGMHKVGLAKAMRVDFVGLGAAEVRFE